MNKGTRAWANWNKVVHKKSHYFKKIVEMGYSVMVSDIDMVWLKNPFSRMNDSEYAHRTHLLRRLLSCSSLMDCLDSLPVLSSHHCTVSTSSSPTTEAHTAGIRASVAACSMERIARRGAQLHHCTPISRVPSLTRRLVLQLGVHQPRDRVRNHPREEGAVLHEQVARRGVRQGEPLSCPS